MHKLFKKRLLAEKQIENAEAGASTTPSSLRTARRPRVDEDGLEINDDSKNDRVGYVPVLQNDILELACFLESERQFIEQELREDAISTTTREGDDTLPRRTSHQQQNSCSSSRAHSSLKQVLERLESLANPPVLTQDERSDRDSHSCEPQAATAAPRLHDDREGYSCSMTSGSFMIRKKGGGLNNDVPAEEEAPLRMKRPRPSEEGQSRHWMVSIVLQGNLVWSEDDRWKAFLTTEVPHSWSKAFRTGTNTEERNETQRSQK